MLVGLERRHGFYQLLIFNKQNSFLYTCIYKPYMIENPFKKRQCHGDSLEVQ